MNKQSMLLLLALAATVGPVAAQTSPSGNLDFQGLINGGTCDLAAGDVNRTVDLKKAKVTDFASSNIVGKENFSISATCDADVANVTFMFTGNPSLDAIRFENTGSAVGIGLALYSRISGVEQDIGADGSNNLRTVPAVSGTATLDLGAAYYKVAGNVTEGTLISQVLVDLTYN